MIARPSTHDAAAKKRIPARTGEKEAAIAALTCLGRGGDTGTSSATEAMRPDLLGDAAFALAEAMEDLDLDRFGAGGGKGGGASGTRADAGGGPGGGGGAAANVVFDLPRNTFAGERFICGPRGDPQPLGCRARDATRATISE